MSNARHETIADIVAYMRKCADGTEKHGLYDLRDYGTDYLRALADNIEAAMKREREAGAEAAGKESLQVGNAAEMRERLDAVNKVVDDELKKQAHCRSCEWRGKSIRSEPACPCDEDVHGVVFDIDVTDRIVKALRGNKGEEQK